MKTWQVWCQAETEALKVIREENAVDPCSEISRDMFLSELFHGSNAAVVQTDAGFQALPAEYDAPLSKEDIWLILQSFRPELTTPEGNW